MCEMPATTREHVPPKCLFPKESELMELALTGVDFRRNLITVPSCEFHNLGKSGDDEYLWYLLGASPVSNSLGRDLFLLRGKRAWNRRPGLLKSMLSTAIPTIAKDELGEYETGKILLDKERFALMMEKIGKAMYFKHFGKKYYGPVVAHEEYTGVGVSSGGRGGPQFGREFLRTILEYRLKIKEEFKNEAEYGDNKEIFFYSIKVIDEVVKMRLAFYGGTKIILVFGEDGFSWLRSPMAVLILHKGLVSEYI
jgi:hypothetical protein